MKRKQFVLAMTLLILPVTPAKAEDTGDEAIRKRPHMVAKFILSHAKELELSSGQKLEIESLPAKKGAIEKILSPAQLKLLSSLLQNRP